MATGKWDTTIAVVCIVLVAGVFFARPLLLPLVQAAMRGISPPEKPYSNITFDCNDGKNFKVLFYSGDVHVHLSDGRDVILPHLSSANEDSYATDTSSMILISGSSTATIEEGPDHTSTYSNCTPLKVNYS
jgi:hypothetical protein